MFLRPALALLAALLLASPVAAESEEDVYARIESIHGNADGFFEVFSLLQDAVMFGDPVTWGQYAFFPLVVNANGETYDVLEEQDLADNFDMLVSSDTQQAFLNQDVADLIVTSEGVGVGNGAVWISNVCLDDDCAATQWGIIAINN
ncbi:hypothetical protein GGR20_001430 [Devosia subaequoris]|uniref:DUF4864 domain-containing protein n=1 Tax=Devosia subaequoris TaxID=395930 RepID=A0A7W6ILI3_9HYPH|nr:hypothetical protein [Devosia subaequoris]MBB4051788.1 hypothetical protein [Devosia subaequoris]MCP1210947.1 hypothetical protein [Devosia subaequoris]